MLDLPGLPILHALQNPLDGLVCVNTQKRHRVYTVGERREFFFLGLVEYVSLEESRRKKSGNDLP